MLTKGWAYNLVEEDIVYETGVCRDDVVKVSEIVEVARTRHNALTPIDLL